MTLCQKQQGSATTSADAMRPSKRPQVEEQEQCEPHGRSPVMLLIKLNSLHRPSPFTLKALILNLGIFGGEYFFVTICIDNGSRASGAREA